jgi:hypothetical protein
VARGSQKHVLKIVPKTREFTVVFVPFFGHFRPDFNIRAPDRVRLFVIFIHKAESYRSTF